MKRLFVYGTLAPGQPNAHMLADIAGSWEPAVARGHLRPGGWGAAHGFPGIVLDERGEDVPGHLLSAPDLSRHWRALDAFEGADYERVITRVRRRDGRATQACIYVLRGGSSPGEP